ncbi:trigger factor [Bartonella sp. DGB1]|uniref:trigger factor n=1 Tax=Bartonella sp. DGB1 TaxID=3239807 RepID=UPI0035256E0B
MQFTETLKDGLKRKIQVTVKVDELAEKAKEKFQELSRTADLKGFRRGHVPILHIKKMYGTSVMAELINDSITKASHSILEERGERPAVTPKVELTEDKKEIDNIIAGKADLVFSLAYEVLPEIDISNVQTISVEREMIELTKEEIEEQILKTLENTRDFTVKEGAAETGDRLKFNYLGKLDDKPFEGGAAENAHLILGSNSFIPGFEDKLLGMKAGDKNTIEVTFPENYHAENLAGKKATFDVEIHEVQSAAPVVLSDEAAQKLGLENLDKLREAVQRQIESYYGSFTRQKVKKNILDALDEIYTFTLPEELVEGEFQNIWAKVQEEMKHNNQTFESENLNEDQEKSEYRRLAERRVRLGLVLSEYGRVGNIEVTEEELQRALYDQLRQYPGQEQEIYKLYQSNPQMIDMLKAPVFEEKVIDHLLSQIKVTDKVVSKEELMQLSMDNDKKNKPAKKKTVKKTAKSSN